jgi:hypothetical protein
MTAHAHDADELATEWLAKSQREVGQRYSGLDDAAHRDPEVAWATIVKIVAHTLTGEQLAFLAAGPLEVLLSQHGPAFIDRVEHEAAKNRRFDNLLGGVWKLGMSDDVWQRVQKARSAIW